MFANLNEEGISDEIFISVQEEALPVIRVTLFNRFFASTAGRQLILQAAGENVVREGYLKKSKKNRSWKKRFCVLYGEPPILRYYKSSSEIGEPQGEIDLSKARLVNISGLSGNAGQDARSQFVMDVENLKKGTQRFYFSCAVALELEEWMTALRTIIQTAGLADNVRRTIMLGKSLEGHTGMDLVNFKPSNTSIQLPSINLKKVDSPPRGHNQVINVIKKTDMSTDTQEKKIQNKSCPLNEILNCKKELINTRTGKEVTFEIVDGIAKVNDAILDDLSSILVSFEISQINSTFKFQGTLDQNTQFQINAE